MQKHTSVLLYALLVPSANGLIIQKQQGEVSPVRSWAHKVLKSKCFSKQHDFRVRADSLTLLGLAYQGRKTKNPGAGIGEIEPFEQVLKDGYLTHECLKDGMLYHGDKYYDNKHDYTKKLINVSVVHYSAVVVKMDQVAMTPDVCFDFCRTVPDMDFFGIRNGRECYCEPWFERIAGDSASCDAVCEGDPTLMCGSKSKSQIFEMHRCSDTEGDLKDGIAQLAEATKALSKKAKFFSDMATKGQKDAKDFQGLLQNISDFGATNLLREAWNRAYDLGKLADEANKTSAALVAGGLEAKKLLGDAFFQQASAAKPDFTDFKTAKKAEATMANMEKLRGKGKAMVQKLEKAQDMYEEVTDPDRAALVLNRSSNFYHGYYFVQSGLSGASELTAKKGITAQPYTVKNWGKDKSTCGGDLAAEPIFGVSEDGCAYACDQTNGCEAYQYFAKSTTICMLLTKVTEVTHYDMCAKALGGECAPKPPKQQTTTLLEQSQKEALADVPFPWKTKSKDANSTLFEETVKGMCTTVYGCGGKTPLADCSLMDHYKCNRVTSADITDSGGVLRMEFSAWLKSGQRSSSCKVNPVPCSGCKKYSTCSGPYAETEDVLIKQGDVASYSWTSSGATDNYEVFVGLYSKTCGLVDFQFQRGDKQEWKTFELFAPKTDKYYMKFLLASYDGSGGGAVGADMEVKEVKQTKATVPRVFSTSAKCMLRLSSFTGMNIAPDPKGQCKDCLKKSTKRCLKPDESFPTDLAI